MKIKLSAGTQRVLGHNRIKIDGLPTTAYLLVDGVCRNSCLFCTQSISSSTNKKMLSRVSWPEEELDRVITDLGPAYANDKLRRACIQSVDNDLAQRQIREVIQRVHEEVKIPTCVSASVASLDDVRELVEMGVDKISIAIDAVSPDIYYLVKGNDYQEKLDLLLDAARTFPNRMATHLIVGLGETEEEMVKMIALMLEHGVTIGLFAFTPVKGTALDNRQAPAVDHYRRIQLAFYLLKEKLVSYENMTFDKIGRLVDFGMSQDELIEMIRQSQGAMFETTGCDDCNRPYYNERPGGIIYNYPRQLLDEEVTLAIRELNF